ncbi:hypothetical protein Nepgr_001793 [Nepenthes gracilis]|uniref:Calcineurin-like phosphoesterase domain-containing protein n=1 Tax=Nepenthes gracilis TaxID=150966 RepID=A0AAD3P531_NEPGR|nr:hypothetical protein Nepgr_001793 [Nepenthes gracilis]
MPLLAISHQTHEGFEANPNPNSRKVIDVRGGPDSLVWVVQLSDAHFSVHHHDRALDFQKLVGPALSIINPSLVLITGDLTDGKSKDMLAMNQDEKEWIEYQNVMEEVVKRSGLDKSIFYDVRGNHDNFGVPLLGGSYDFFSNYSLNAQAGRRGNVNSVTLQTKKRRYLFVGVDTTMAIGLRGPTNLFGHPTDALLAELDSELSQWNFELNKPVIKIVFGHFPLSFLTASETGKTLKDVFLKCSISAYICGHLHAKLGKNLKRHHQLHSSRLFQLNMHQTQPIGSENCLHQTPETQEFWEWEMGDWRSSRAMRILAIDRGHVSFVDIDFKSGGKETIILPTFPLDSRLMWTRSLLHNYECNSMDPSSYTTIRALVFSAFPVVSVVAKVYDSRSGNLLPVMEASMRKHEGDSSRGDLYSAPWNFKAFEDPSPQRYWLQIEAIDNMGISTLSELRPFSINGLSSQLSWTWKEFLVMGCQWDALYYPVLWISLGFCLFSLLIPMALPILFKKQFSFKNFCKDKGVINGFGWALTELHRLHVVWIGMLGYLFYLILFPWFSGRVFTDGGERLYMTYKGWVVKLPDTGRKIEFIGVPDIMVIVLPHLFLVVLPSIFAEAALAAEWKMYRIHFLSLSGKKEDDCVDREKKCYQFGFRIGTRWIRKLLILLCLGILFKHFQNCRALLKAYEMNPLLHCPVYIIGLPLILSYTIYKTGRV